MLCAPMFNTIGLFFSSPIRIYVFYEEYYTAPHAVFVLQHKNKIRDGENKSFASFDAKEGEITMMEKKM